MTAPLHHAAAAAGPASAPPAARRLAGALTLTAMSLGFVVVQLDVTVVNVAIEKMGSSLGTGIAGLQWVVTAYTLVFASLILTAGALGDRLGAKRVFLAGFVVFGAASFCCGLAPNLAILVAGRALQGAGAAILVPCSLALLNHAYRDPEERGRAVAIWAGGASVALAAGPVVGGVLIAAVGWRSIFFINLPIAAIALWLTSVYAREATRERGAGLDLAGQALAILALAALAAAMIGGGAGGWLAPWTLGAAAVFMAAAGALVRVEARSRAPMLPLSLFADRTFSATTLIGLLMNVAFYGLIFVLSLYFQQVEGYTALRTGFAFLPMTAVVLAANLAAPRLAARYGPRLPIAGGQALLAAGCWGLTAVGAGSSYGALACQLLLIGIGVGLTVPPMTAALLGTVARRRSGIASGVLNSARQAGSVIGVALFGSFVTPRAHFVAGLHAALYVSGALALAAGLLALRLPPRSEGQQLAGAPSRADG